MLLCVRIVNNSKKLIMKLELKYFLNKLKDLMFMSKKLFSISQSKIEIICFYDYFR